MAQAGTEGAFSWAALSAGNDSAKGQASDEARTLARALAAQSVVFDKEAEALDLEDRLEAIYGTIWPAQPLEGYGLHSSLGAFLVTKVAVGLVPAVRKGLRKEALKAKGILHALEEHGVAEPTGISMLGAFAGVPPDFKGSDQGLTTSLLAGLAERTLTRAERDRALAQVAYSPRCLTRLSSAAALLAQIRDLLPVLPPAALGARFTAMMAALSFGLPERALELDDPSDDDLPLLTVRELAQVVLALSRAERPQLSNEGLALPQIAPPRAPKPHEADALFGGGNTDAAFRDAFFQEKDRSEDVLEIVEERADPTSGRPTLPLEAGSLPRPTRFGDGPRLRDDELAAFVERLEGARGGRRTSWLGLKLLKPAPTVLPIPTPPDEQTLSDQPDAVLRALFPPIRAVLRAIVQAAEGRPPTEVSLSSAGDLEWAMRRAEALALVVRGELEAAERAVEGLPAGASPEARWAADRLLRFGQREPEPVSAEEARPMAAALVADLAHQLGRTLAGTVPASAEAEL